MRTLEWLVAIMLAVLTAAATFSGMLMNFLFIFLLISVAHKLPGRLFALTRKNLYWDLWKEVRNPEARRYVLQAVSRCVLWIVMGICVRVAMVSIQFSEGEWKTLMWMLYGSVALLCLMEWMPRRRLALGPNVLYGLMLVFLVFQLITTYLPGSQKSAVVVTPPFEGKWYVMQGGNSVLINHHHYAGSQRFATDLIPPQDGPLFLKEEKDLQKYQAFGQVLTAPVDGIVAALENEQEDQPVGASDLEHPAGNYVTIQTDAGSYILLAHLQKGSVLVSQGQRVRTGEPIARCGNSGNTSQPHIHIQAMTGLDAFDDASKPLPIMFKTGKEAMARSYRANEIVEGISPRVSDVAPRSSPE